MSIFEACISRFLTNLYASNLTCKSFWPVQTSTASFLHTKKSLQAQESTKMNFFAVKIDSGFPRLYDQLTCLYFEVVHVH